MATAPLSRWLTNVGELAIACGNRRYIDHPEAELGGKEIACASGEQIDAFDSAVAGNLYCRIGEKPAVARRRGPFP